LAIIRWELIARAAASIQCSPSPAFFAAEKEIAHVAILRSLPVHHKDCSLLEGRRASGLIQISRPVRDVILNLP
jgi:hypothetical protein